MRVSATWLDGFLLYRNTDWKQLDELEASIRREPFEESEALKLGKAFHAVAEGVAERCGDDEHAAYCYGGYTFDAQAADVALGPFSGGVCEVRTTHDVMTHNGPVTLSCVADQLKGNVTGEIKTSMKPIDPQRYADSYQWRCYLLAFNTARVDYLLAHLSKPRDMDIWFATADILPLYPYPGLRQDVERLTGEFIDFCRDRDLIQYLTERKAA